MLAVLQLLPCLHGSGSVGLVDDDSDIVSGAETYLLQLQFSLQVGKIPQRGLPDNHSANASLVHATTFSNRV